MANITASQGTMVKSEVDLQRIINGSDAADRLVSRTSNLLQNKSFTDVTFIVGPPSHSKKYVGHRVLLAMTSPVFEALFYGDTADKSKVIRIPDLAPVGFENLLRYAYTDSLNLVSVEDAMLTAYAAKKYLLPHLLRECLNFIDKNVSPSSVCSVLEFAASLNSSHLEYQAIQVLDRQTYQVLSHKSLNTSQASTMATICSRRYLNIYSEASLISAALSWGACEVRRRGGDPGDFVSIRNVLQDSGVLRNLRFLALTPEEFTRIIAQTTGHHHHHHYGDIDTGAGGDGGRDSSLTLRGEGGGDDDPATHRSLLSKTEQVAVFMNLSIPSVRPIPKALCSESRGRTAPPEYFVVRRFKPLSYATATSITQVTSVTGIGKQVRQAVCKFQSMTPEVAYIVGAVIPVRLDTGFYSVRTPKLDLQLKFSSKPGVSSDPPPLGARGSEEPILLDATDETGLSASLSKDKDCIVRLRRPLIVKRGHMNEITLHFGSNDQELVVIRKSGAAKAAGNQAEITDAEGLNWNFFKSNNCVEFSELYYYY